MKRLRLLYSCGLLQPLDLQLLLNRLPQIFQIFISLDPTEPRLQIQKGRRQPPLLLLSVLPMAHLPATPLGLAEDGLDDVRGLQTHAQFLEHSQAMQRQRLLHPFQQAPGRRRIPHPKFLLQL